jgi:hypothetical protein
MPFASHPKPKLLHYEVAGFVRAFFPIDQAALRRASASPTPSRPAAGTTIRAAPAGITLVLLPRSSLARRHVTGLATLGSATLASRLFSDIPAPWSKAIRDIPKKRGRGRPNTTGRGIGILVRLQPGPLNSLDGWANAQKDKPSRPEAIRRLVDLGLKSGALTH